MRRFLLFCAVLLFALGVFSAASQASQPDAAGPVTIAVIAAKTGDASTSNLVMFETARFAVDEINARGGFQGHPVAILELDNRSTPLGSKAAAEDAVAQNVLAVIGASWSSHSNAMAPVLQAAGIPMISPISTNQDVTLHGDYIFRACYTDPLQARVMARFARDDLDVKKMVSLINVSRTYSVNLAEYFKQFFTAFGGEILWEGEFLIDSADYRELLIKAMSYSPDALYVPGDYRDSSFIIKQARDMNLDVEILGADAFGMRLFDYIGDAANGCYYTTNWHRDSPLPESRDFVQRYEKERGEIKQTTIPLTYDAVMLLDSAVQRAGSLDRQAIRQALAETTDFKGVSGLITFDENGDPIKPVVVNKLQNGGITFIRNVAP